MSGIEKFFDGKTFDFLKLAEYGFKKEGRDYVYRSPIADGEFTLAVTVFADGTVGAQAIENSLNEEYVLFSVADADGAFVTRLRAEAEKIYCDIAEKCCRAEIFKEAGITAAINYAKEKYGDEPEFLWQDENAVLRRADTGKWYAVIMKVKAEKVGAKGEKAEIIDLRVPPQNLETLLDGKNLLPAYHMNKKHWITVLPNGVPYAALTRLIDESYSLAVK